MHGWKGEIRGSEHDGENDIPESSYEDGHDEEEYHEETMEGEEGGVLLSWCDNISNYLIISLRNNKDDSNSLIHSMDPPKDMHWTNTIWLQVKKYKRKIRC